MSPITFPFLQLSALTIAVAALSACGGGSDPVVATTNAESSAATSAQTECSTASTTTMPTTSNTHDDDGDSENERESDKSSLAKTTTSCPAASDTTTAGTTTGTTTSTSPAASASALNGKSLYQASCASCHGGNPAQNVSRILNGSNPSNILNAIASNKGGMGYLGGSIGSAQASDIAAYLANPGI